MNPTKTHRRAVVVLLAKLNDLERLIQHRAVSLKEDVGYLLKDREALRRQLHMAKVRR